MLLDHIGTLIIYPLYADACIVDGVELMGELVPKNAKSFYSISCAFVNSLAQTLGDDIANLVLLHQLAHPFSIKPVEVGTVVSIAHEKLDSAAAFIYCFF